MTQPSRLSGIACFTKPTLAIAVSLLTVCASGPAWSTDLLTITRDALDNNAALASAKSTLDGSQAARDGAAGRLKPQLSGSGRLVRDQEFSSQQPSVNPGESDVTSVSFSLEATQSLYDQVRKGQLDQANEQIEARRFALAVTEQQVLIDVVSAYFEILRADELLESRVAQERAIQRQLEQAREQFEVGLIAITEVEEAKAAYDQSRAIRLAAESDLQVRFESLERLTGQRYSNIAALGEEMPIALPEPRQRQYWVDQALEKNPQVLASQAEVELARRGVELSRAEAGLSLNAFANYSYADNDRDGLSGHNANGQVGVRASLPIYTGGSTSAAINESTFQLSARQYDFEDQRRAVVQRVRSRYTQVSNNVTSVEARRQAVVSNRSALEATRAGYEVGTRNIVDVLNAEQRLFGAVADLASARYDYVINLLTLRQQSGLLDVAAIEEVNAWLTGDNVDFTLPEDDARQPLEIGDRPTR